MRRAALCLALTVMFSAAPSSPLGADTQAVQLKSPIPTPAQFLEFGRTLGLLKGMGDRAETLRDRKLLSLVDYTKAIDAVIAAMRPFAEFELSQARDELQRQRADVASGAKDAGSYSGEAYAMSDYFAEVMERTIPSSDVPWFSSLGEWLGEVAYAASRAGNVVFSEMVIDRELYESLGFLQIVMEGAPTNTPSSVRQAVSAVLSLSKYTGFGSPSRYTAAERGRIRAASLAALGVDLTGWVSAPPAPAPAATQPVAPPAANADAAIKDANDAVNAGRNDEAVGKFTAILLRDPGNAVAQIGLGVAEFGLWHYDKALAAFDRTVALEPNNALARYWRGSAVWGSLPWYAGDTAKVSARLADVIAAMNQALSLDPAMANAYFRRAWARLGSHDGAGALADARAFLAAAGYRAQQSPVMSIVGAIGARLSNRETDATQLLDDCAVKCDTAAWSYQIVRYYRRQITAEQLTAQATDTVKQTQAETFLGMDLLLASQPTAPAHFLQADRMSQQNLSEYVFARIENIRMSGGIGAGVTIRDRKVTIESVDHDSPASRAGLQAGDQIVSIDGRVTEGLALDLVTLLLNGTAGSSVALTVQVPGAGRARDIVIVRETIKR